MKPFSSVALTLREICHQDPDFCAMLARVAFCGIAIGIFGSFLVLSPVPRQREATYRTSVSTVCEPYGNTGAEICQ